MQERDFKGVWIPKEIWLCKELSALDRVIYAEIDSLDNENHCIASNEYFAEFCGVSEPTVTRSIQKLIDCGYIEKVSFDGRHRVLKVIKQTNQNDYPASSKCTSNNIDSNTANKGVSNNKLLDIITPKKKESKKKASLYQQCSECIDSYTNNVVLNSLLHDYLTLRLAMKDKPIYGVNQWKGLLNKLDELCATTNEPEKIVRYSIERGYASFFIPNTYNNQSRVKADATERNVDTVKKSEDELDLADEVY